MKPQILGGLNIQKVVDMVEPFDAARAYPGADLTEFRKHRSWLAPHFFDYDLQTIILSFHSYVIRSPHHTIIVDTCIGNDKDRGGMVDGWGHRTGPWLDNLKAAGVQPEEVDYVMCTHLHADHVGWNTKLENGRWVPTFPRARYVFSRADLAMAEEQAKQSDAYAVPSYEDSVLPVVEAGQVELVDTDFSLDDGVTILPTPGHTPGHYCVRLIGGGAEAILTGDLLHNPVQVSRPDWTTMFCNDKEHANAQRVKFVDDYTDTDVTILAAHFGGPTAGYFVSSNGGRKFQIKE